MSISTPVPALEDPVGGARRPPPARPVTSPLRRHLNLTRELAITQFKLKYTGSALGYVWSLINPLALFGTMYLVFVVIFQAGKISPHFPMQLLLGIVLWTFFAETTSTAMNSIAGNGGMLRKAYFPRSILVVASSMTALMSFLINSVLMLLLAVALGQSDLGWHSLLTPVFIVELYVVVLGLSLILSALFVFYRDLGHIWAILTQILFYGSAVVFPVVAVHSHVLRALLAINPVFQIVEDLRHALISTSWQVPWSETMPGVPGVGFLPYVIVLALAGVGLRVFSFLTPRFAEYL